MNSKKICDVMRREINSALEAKSRSFFEPSKMSISYEGFDNESYQHIFKVTVTGINKTFIEGIGFTMTTMFDTLKTLGFFMEGYGKKEDDGDTYVYTYIISDEALTHLTNP